jgi:hypothetical protein
MGDRGSKSVIKLFFKTAKEQRVDGDYGLVKNVNKILHYSSKPLRCTLIGFERNYPVKFPSKQINKFVPYGVFCKF